MHTFFILPGEGYGCREKNKTVQRIRRQPNQTFKTIQALNSIGHFALNVKKRALIEGTKSITNNLCVN